MTNWEAEHQRLAESCAAVVAACNAQRLKRQARPADVPSAIQARERAVRERYEREDTWEARAEWLRARREARRCAS